MRGRWVLAGSAAVAACVGAGSATAAPIVSTQSTYRAYSVWDEWRPTPAARCAQTQPVHLSEPAAPGRYPVLVYLHGTLADWGGNAEGRRIAELAAAEGFVAASPSFDSWMSGTLATVDGNARCLFDATTPASPLARLCAHPKADCSRGIAVAGFSAGGAIAGRAANASPRVRAAWLIGVSDTSASAAAAPGGTRALPNDRVRITIGESDGSLAGTAGLRRMTGGSCASPTSCLRPDGSGYYVVPDAEVADGVADHCFWQGANPVVPGNSCTWTPELDPGFRASAATPWSLSASLAWLRSRLG